MDAITLQFSSSTAWQSGVIRRLCHSVFSHVDLVLDEGLLGASGPDKKLHDPGGVLIRSFHPWDYSIRRRVTIKTDKADAIVALAQSQLGKPFDQSALYSFLSNPAAPDKRDWRDPVCWFCSELMTWVLESASFFPYPLIVHMDRVSPSDLLLLLNPWVDPKTFWQRVPGLELDANEQ